MIARFICEQGSAITKGRLMRNMPLGRKLFISFILAATIPVIAVALVSYRISSGTQGAIMEESLDAFKKGVDSVVANAMQKLKSLGATTTSDPNVVAAIEAGDLGSLASCAKALLENTDNALTYAVFTDAQGKAIASGDDRRKIGDPSAWSVVRKALGGTFSVGIEATEASALDLHAAYPILDRNGRTAGCAVMGVDLAAEQFVDPIKAAYGVECTLFSGDTRVATTIVAQGRRVIGSKLNNPRIVSDVLAGGKVIHSQGVIFNNTYKTVYWPIVSIDDKPMGMYFVGKSMNIVEEAASRQMRAAVLLVAAVVVIAFLLAFLITKSIVGPLTGAVKRLTDATERTGGASELISRASASLVNVAGEQAAAMEESSAAVEELSGMARQNRDTAENAGKLMEETQNAAEAANSAMRSMVATMDEIKDSSEQISGIIKTIQDISFQTNLLALNAAVEAARAGEHGKGFAVVADEVRNLAQRAGEAARTTSAIIESSVAISNRGAAEVAEAANWIDGTRQNAESVAKLVQSVSGASAEQSNGIDQINGAVNNMDKGTQQVAENSKDVAQSARDLNALSEEMERVVQDIALVIGMKNPNAPTKKTPPAGGAVHRKSTRMLPAPT